MDGKRIDFNLLATLEVLLTERNVTKAAARLHLSQPAVSAQLNRLRAVFDDALLVPVQRGMAPTAKALELLEPLRAALDQVRAAVATHRQFDPATADMVVSIACTDYPQVAVVAPLIKHLRKLAPGMRVALRNLDATQLEAQMLRGEVDLALMTPQTAPPSLRMRRLYDERYVLIGRRNHPQLRDKLTTRNFARLEHVVVSPSGGGFTTQVDATLAARGLQRNVVLSCASFLFVPQIVAQTDFVALVPERLVQTRMRQLSVRDCPLPVGGFAMAMVWHEHAHAHAGQRWLRDTAASLFNA